MNNDQIFSGVRTLIQALCMFALGRGWIKPDDVPGLVAIGVAAATVGYGLYARRNTALVASAAAEAQDLYTVREGREAFEFDRTVSRLIEMRSTEYLALPHGRADSEASGATTGLVET